MDNGRNAIKVGHMAMRKAKSSRKKYINENPTEIHYFDIEKCKHCNMKDGCYKEGTKSKTYTISIKSAEHTAQKEFQESGYFKEKVKERYKIEAKNSEQKHRHGYDVASSSGLLCMEMQGALHIYSKFEKNSPYFMPNASAVYAWNNPPAPCSCEILPNTSSETKVYAASLPAGIGGTYSVITLGGSTHHKTTKFSITINTYYGSESSDFLQSEACHEMGHALGLDDDGSSDYSIMNWDRDRETVNTPFVSDCYGLQYIWSL